MEGRKYIHYGHKQFIPEAFTPIRNCVAFTKPYGGLWASPVDAEFGWKEWCEREDFRECDTKNSFTFTLSESAKVLTISSVTEARRLPQVRDELTLPWWVIPDFEELVWQGYDAVELKLSEDWSLYQALYGWDCDSILVMNPEVVVSV